MPEYAFTPIASVMGGLLIGVAATLVLKSNGQIAGISGILNAALAKRVEQRSWRILFLAGLIVAGVFYRLINEETLVQREHFSTVRLIAAGLLVGFGTRLGNGCTSGHGVCGIARLSHRSITATAVFLATAMLTASGIFQFVMPAP